MDGIATPFHGAVMTPAPLTLGWMPQQTQVLAPEEDWTGISSQAERRKLQNRLNQRAYRKRKADELKQDQRSSKSPRYSSPPFTSLPHHTPLGPHGVESIGGPRPVPKSNLQGTNIGDLSKARAPNSLSPTSSHPVLSIYKVEKAKHARPPCQLDPEDAEKLLDRFEKLATMSYISGSPTSDHLLTLIKFNVHRAFVRNSYVIGLPWRFVQDDDALSLFSNPTPGHGHLEKPMPLSLRPTHIQRTIPHHPWFDLIPVPGIRDNLIRTGEDNYDEQELCEDLVGFCGGTPGNEGLIVWGESWDPSGWEVTEDFTNKWFWTLRGCKDLLESTNRWRRMRGEKPLCWDISDPESVHSSQTRKDASNQAQWQSARHYDDSERLRHRITEIS